MCRVCLVHSNSTCKIQRVGLLFLGEGGLENKQEGYTSTKSFINDYKRRRLRNNHRYKKHGGNFVNKRNVPRRFQKESCLKWCQMTYHNVSKELSLYVCRVDLPRRFQKQPSLYVCAQLIFKSLPTHISLSFFTCLLHSSLFYFASSSFFCTLLQGCRHHLARRTGERRRRTHHRTRHRCVTSTSSNSPPSHSPPCHCETPAPHVVETPAPHVAENPAPRHRHVPALALSLRAADSTDAQPLLARTSVTAHALFLRRHRTRTPLAPSLQGVAFPP